MEASPSRSDSFSRGGWPRCRPRSFERLDVDAAALGESFSISTASFIDMDPEELFSMRWTTSEEGGFHFGLQPRAGAACSFPLLASAGLVIFSDDSLLHLPCEGGARDVSGSYADASACSSPAAFHTAHSTPASVISSSSRSPRPGAGGANKPLLATRRILLRYLRFLVPLCRKARALRLPVPVPGRVFSAPRSRAVAPTTPARRSTSSASSGAAEYWCHGNADVAVHDAILHCKKSLLTARTEC
ncbi:probable membrane-associated kinase regulator 6 [Miscanthus floridulus]|uniref:probable membrane-associated kinase regulator 6 n=1 Tax=Miscanthus floridulus TaxID=154761 RepID=UPI00345757F4